MFTVKQISDLTGLSRSQVDQMISRHGFKPTQAALESGAARRFSRADAIRYCLISALREIGLPWETVREVDNDSGFANQIFNPRSTDALDDYPNEKSYEDKSNLLFVVAYSGTGPSTYSEKNVASLRGEICHVHEILDWIAKGNHSPGAVIVDFSAILKRVDATLEQVE